MDILYIIGQGSKWQDNELKYSLRSIEKNCTGVDRIFIGGYCPSFIDKSKVTFLSVHDDMRLEGKHKRVMDCFERVLDSCDIADDFLLSADDHFYVQPTDFDNYPFYRKGISLPRKYEVGKPYNNTLVSTRIVLEAAGLTINDFSWHGNTHFNKTLFLEPQFEAMRKISYNMQLGCELSILMLNYWLARRPFEITDREDIKFPTDMTLESLKDMVQKRECISCASAAPDVLKKWLMTEFPYKSKYEK